MRSHYTYLWTGQEFRLHESDGPRPLVHAGSNRFLDRGVQPGDFLYIWSYLQGKLYVIGRIEVDEVGPLERIRTRLRYLRSDNPYSDHVVARSPMSKQFNTTVPLKIILKLRFIDPGGQVKSVVLRPDGRPEPQTFRGVRRIQPASAALLDVLLRLRGPKPDKRSA